MILLKCSCCIPNCPLFIVTCDKKMALNYTCRRWIAMQFTVQSHRLSTIGDQYLVRNLRQIDGIYICQRPVDLVYIHLIQGEVGGLV